MGDYVKRVSQLCARFCTRYERRIVATVTALIIAGVSFISGMMMQSATATAPLVIEHGGVESAPLDAQGVDTNGIAQSALEKDVEAPVSKGCAYVGSKNSTKYYPPTCSFAKRIAPENLRCFTSDEDAQNKGYVRSKGC